MQSVLIVDDNDRYANNLKLYFDKINILGDPISPDTDKFYSANKPNKVIELLVKNKKVNTKLADNDGLKANEMTDNKEIIQLINSNK
jgi:hypothetical protein